LSQTSIIRRQFSTKGSAFPADEFEHPRIELAADPFVFRFHVFPVPLGGINGLDIDKSRLV
jgi:hypothetical protein